MSRFVRFELAVYLPSDGRVQPMRVLSELLRAHPRLKLADDLPKEPETMLLRAQLNENVADSYAPPSEEQLRYAGHGLSSKQVDQLQKSKRALVLQFAHSQKDVWTALRTAAELVSEIASKTDGLVWDEETREVFTPEAWRERRLGQWTEPPRVSRQTTIHLYDTGQSLRAITLGMAKMGLPDLVVENTKRSSSGQIGNLINLVGQALAEGAGLSKSGEFKLVLQQIRNDGQREESMKSLKPNATKAGCLILAPGKWEDGDPRNSLIQLAFDKYPGSDSDARQESMVSSFFGWEDHVAEITHDDELLSASKQAKQQLGALQNAFVAGFQPGESLQVKAPFKTESGGNEWMWVEVKTWRGDKIGGVLNNMPEEVIGLHPGQHVEVRQEEIFDYIHTFPDKRTEGNTTGAILDRRQKGRDAWRPVNRESANPKCDAASI